MSTEEPNSGFTLIVAGGFVHPGFDELANSILGQSRLPSHVLLPDGIRIGERIPAAFRDANIKVETVKDDRPEICCRLNSALEVAQTPVVVFVASGLRLEPDCFERLVGSLERFADHGVAMTSGQVVCSNPRSYDSVLSLIERLMRLRSREPGELIRSGYSAPWDHSEEELGGEPFDIDYAGLGIVAAFREDCLADPFPKGYSLIASNWMELFSCRITRKKRALFVPIAKARPVEQEPPSAFAEGSQEVLGAYWVHRQFARRGPFSFLHFRWASCWLAIVSLIVSIFHPSRFPYAAGVVSGFGESIVGPRSLRRAVEKAAAQANIDICFLKHLDTPLLADPLEPGHDEPNP